MLLSREQEIFFQNEPLGALFGERLMLIIN